MVKSTAVARDAMRKQYSIMASSLSLSEHSVSGAEKLSEHVGRVVVSRCQGARGCAAHFLVVGERFEIDSD